MEISIGLFAGIFNEGGKLLLRRRNKESPEIFCSHEGDWELPGGTMEESNILNAKDERIIGEELAREIEEETGISASLPIMPKMFPFMKINPENKDIDMAFLVPYVETIGKPTKGKNIYVSPNEIQKLALNSKGNRLVSGFGNRMHRMALKALTYSENVEYKSEARKILSKIVR